MAGRWRTAKGRDWDEVDVDALMVELESAMAASAALCSDLVPGAAACVSALFGTRFPCYL